MIRILTKFRFYFLLFSSGLLLTCSNSSYEQCQGLGTTQSSQHAHSWVAPLALEGSTLMTSFNLIYLAKVPSPNTLTLEEKALEKVPLWGTETFCSQHQGYRLATTSLHHPLNFFFFFYVHDFPKPVHHPESTPIHSAQ